MVGPPSRVTEVLPRPHKSKPRPVRTFRAIGVFFLALGAVAGVYVAVSRTGHPDTSSQLSVDVLDVSPSVTPSADPAKDQALALAQEKAAAAAVEAADKMKKANEAAQRTQPASRSDTRPTATQPPYKVPASCGEYTGNRAIGCAVLLENGFGLDQMPCLDKLFTKESGWNPKARNPTSGAYGVPQASPGNKMASFGADWQTNVATQVKWGISYIKNRYKTPCGAWAHSQATGWY
jgi:hypothetical protein